MVLGPAVRPSRALPEVRKIPKMVPHGSPASMLADPSRGSKTAAYSPLCFFVVFLESGGNKGWFYYGPNNIACFQQKQTKKRLTI